MRSSSFNWVPFSSIAETVSRVGRRLKTDEYHLTGRFPIIDQGKAKIVGYTDDESNIVKELPLIVFGDHTRIVKYVDFPFAVGADGVKLLRLKDKQGDARYLAAITMFAAESLPELGYSRHFRELSGANVPYLRDPRQQSCICDILDAWEVAIEKTGRLTAAKTAAFDHWSHVLLTGRRRLGRKRANWPSVALTDITQEATARNQGVKLGADAVMGVNKIHGMIPMKDHVRAADLSRYKIVRPRAFAYNPMRLNIGSIAQNNHARDVLVSPDYVAFETDPDVLLPAYFEHLRRTSIWSRFVRTAGSGGVRVRIYYEDLSDFILELPPIEEQARIVEALDTGRREIAILEQQRDALVKQKRGLMQKLLTGEWPLSAAKSREAAE